MPGTKLIEKNHPSPRAESKASLGRTLSPGEIGTGNVLERALFSKLQKQKGLHEARRSTKGKPFAEREQEKKAKRRKAEEERQRRLAASNRPVGFSNRASESSTELRVADDDGMYQGDSDEEDYEDNDDDRDLLEEDAAAALGERSGVAAAVGPPVGFGLPPQSLYKNCCNKELIDSINDLIADFPGFFPEKISVGNCEKYVNNTTMVAFINYIHTKINGHQFASSMWVVGGGGKINQKGGDRAWAKRILGKLFRFSKRAAACTLLAAAIEASKGAVCALASKIIGVTITVGGAAAQATASGATTAALLPGTFSVVLGATPPLLLAGLGVAVALDIGLFFYHLRGDPHENTSAETRLNQRISEAERVAVARNVGELAAAVNKDYQDYGDRAQLREDVIVTLTQAQLGILNLESAQENIETIWGRFLKCLPVLKMVNDGLIAADQLVDWVAYLPEDMVNLSIQISTEENEKIREELYQQFKNKGITMLYLFGAGLDISLIKIMSVPAISYKIGSTVYTTTEAVYQAGIGEATVDWATEVKDSLIRIVERIRATAKTSDERQKQWITDHLDSVKAEIDRMAEAQESFNGLIDKAKERGKSLPVVALTSTVAQEPVEGMSTTGGGSRRRRKNNKPRKRRTLRKKSKRRKSTKRNSRKTTVRRKSRRLSRKSKRLSRKLKK